MTSLLCFAAGGFAPAQAADYWVSTSGSDSNPGSEAAPFKTIQKGADVAGAGDTVTVLPGTYTGPMIRQTKDGTASARIRFVSKEKWGAKIVTNSGNVSVSIFGDYVDVEGFDVTAANEARNGIALYGNYTRALYNHVHDYRAPKCDDGGGAGIGTGSYTTSNKDIIGNVVHHIGTAHLSPSRPHCNFIHGIYAATRNVTVKNNIVYSTSGAGIHLWHDPINNIVSHNLSFSNRASGIIFGCGSAPFGTCSGIKVYNNLFINNNRAIVEYGSNDGSNQVYNNITYGNQDDTPVMKNGSASGNLIGVNPRLANFNPGGSSNIEDYRPATGSPAIDKASGACAACNIASDILLGARPVGAASDIGPLEFGAPPGAAAPPIPGSGGTDVGGIPVNCPPVGIEAAGNPFAPTDAPPATGPITPPPPSGTGTTYYVATNGSDSAAGSATAPWKTIKHAVSRMNAGDTTYVRGGVYSEPPWFGRSGTASAPIKLLNAPGESPVIDCGGEVKFIQFQNGARSLGLPIGHITVEGFEIRNCWHGMSLYNTHDLVIRRNWIHDSKGQGILGNGKNNLIDRNVINRMGDFPRCAVKKSYCNQVHGIYGTGSNWVITNNLIYDNLANGITLGAYKCPGCYQGRSFPGSRYTDESYGGGNGWLIANNTFAYNQNREGIVVWQRLATNAKIINNIFYENSNKVSGSGPQGISFYNSGGGHIVQNNLCYATKPGGTACIGGTPGWEGKYTESGNIVNTVNPGFVGAGPTISGTPNFHLTPSSPAIDKGQSLSQVTWDHAGGKRPFGSTHDIGAYEHGAPPDSGSPPPNPTGGAYSGGPVPPGCPPPFVPDTYIQCIPPDP